MTLTNLCCIHEDSGIVGLNAASAAKLFTVVFRIVVPPFRIKQSDESDYEQTDFEDGRAVAHLVQALRYEPEDRGFDSSIAISHWLNSSGDTMTRCSTEPVTYKGGRCRGLQIVLKSGSLKLVEPTGPFKTCTWIALPFRIRGTCAMFHFGILSYTGNIL